jgi:pSer/pThr/pTyr-binding forkhead associated (FHA) protein
LAERIGSPGGHVITCPKCAKDNQDHYKFCLGCGAELPRDAAPKPFSPQTPPHGMKAASAAANAPAAVANSPGGNSTAGLVGAATVADAPPRMAASALASTAAAPSSAYRPSHVVSSGPAAAQSAVVSSAPSVAPAGTVVCPQCGHVNGPTNLFCGSCGFRLGGAAGARPAQQAVAPPVAAGAVSLTALRADGSEAGTYTLPGGTVTVGRDTGGIFAGDSYLSPRHATFRQAGPGRMSVKDEGSLNGVYKKLQRDSPVEVKPNHIFRIGQEIIRFEPLAPQPATPDGVERLGAPSKGYVGRIALVIGRETTGNAFPIPETGVHLGRERGDVLFPEDGYVSGLHCRLTWEGGRLMLTDLGSSNGTFLRLAEEADVQTGDVLLMGQQLFRVSM